MLAQVALSSFLLPALDGDVVPAEPMQVVTNRVRERAVFALVGFVTVTRAPSCMYRMRMAKGRGVLFLQPAFGRRHSSLGVSPPTTVVFLSCTRNSIFLLTQY